MISIWSIKIFHLILFRAKSAGFLRQINFVRRMSNCLMLNLVLYKIKVINCKVNGLTKSFAKLVLQILTLGIYRGEGKKEHKVMSESKINLKVKLFFISFCLYNLRFYRH